MAYSFVPPAVGPGQVRALLAANRLEARPRSAEFARALRAEVRDPAWLLARQWQLHEFRAEDRGTPAQAAVRLREQPLASLALPDQPARSYSATQQPLEAAVEAQPRVVGLGLRLQMGQLWLRLLRTGLPAEAGGTATSVDVTEGDVAPPPTGRAAGLAVWAVAYPLAPATADSVARAQQTTTAEALALVQLAGSAALDGYRLYQALLAPYATALAPALADNEQLAAALDGRPLLTALLGTFNQASRQAAVTYLQTLDANLLNKLARQYVLTVHRLYLLGQASTSWSTDQMAYSFALGTCPAPAAPARGLGTTHYPGGASLPWYAVDAQPVPAGAPASSPVPGAGVVRRLPTEVLFPGALAARWWEFEDRRVDFGLVQGGATDWGRMLLQEFMLLYQNDWFTVPCPLASGAVSQVEELTVTDVFGQTYQLQPAGAGQRPEAHDPAVLIDNDAGRWQLFAQTPLATSTGAAAPSLYVPATAVSRLVGQPSEQVSFRREEATNLVWAVESIVPDGFVGGLDGGKAAGQTTEYLRRTVPVVAAEAATDNPPAYTYQLMGAVSENWVPFVPVTDGSGAPGLEQGALRRQVPGRTFAAASAEGYVEPRTSLLQLPADQPYRLREHELPPGGLRVESCNYRVRWFGGRTLHWFGRRRGPALAGGSSGLAFDQLLTRATG